MLSRKKGTINIMNQKSSVLLISVDALKPDYVFEQEKTGVSLPNITKYFIIVD